MYKPLIGAALVIFSNTIWADTTHTVTAGDTIGKIAKKYYDDTRQWNKIYQANKTLLGDKPDYLEVGWALTIPGVEEASATEEKVVVEKPKEETKAAMPSTILKPAKPAKLKQASTSMPASVNDTQPKSNKSGADKSTNTSTMAHAEASTKTEKTAVNGDPKAAIEAAIMAAKKANSVGYEWRDTQKIIKKAKAAADNGDAAKAIKLAKKAQAQSERAYEQAMAQKNAAPRF